MNRISRVPAVAAALTLGATTLLTPTPVLAATGTGATSRVSMAGDGTQAALGGRKPDLSADGRIVAFESSSSTLVPGDTNNSHDVFVHDRSTGAVSRVSVGTGGAQGNAYAARPALSADGRHVAFISDATDLVPGDTNGQRDLFVHDRATGVTTRANVASDGTQSNANEDPLYFALSADGRYVVFSSSDSNLVPDDGNLQRDVFLHDRATGTTELVSRSTAVPGQSLPAGGDEPSISPDGRYIAFTSGSTGLPSGGVDTVTHVVVHDHQTGETTRESVGIDGSPPAASSRAPSISGEGRYVAFESDAPNLVVGDTNGQRDVFVRDRQAGTTTRISVGASGAEGDSSSERPGISADGRHVVFDSLATNLVDGDTNAQRDVFLHDRQGASTTLASVATDGSQANGESGGFDETSAVSDSGRYVAFLSEASNLVVGDTNNEPDVFVRDVSGNAPPPVVSVGDVSVVEKDSGARAAVFTVRLSEPTPSTVTVAYATADDTAVAPADYSAASGTLSFDPGTTSRQVSVSVNGDTHFEGHETFTLTLADPIGAVVNDPTAVATIVDDDPTVSVGDATVHEGDAGTRAAVFPVTLSKPSASTVTVEYSTADGTAKAGEDYAAKAGLISFSPGVTTNAVKVAVSGDRADEASSESFSLSLTGASSAVIGDGTGFATTLDDDPANFTGRRLSIGDVRLHEGDAGARTALLNVALSEPSSSYVTVNFATVKGTAAKASDFVAKTGTLSFAPGSTSLNVKVTVNPDTTVEGDESFTVVLSGLSGSGTFISDDTGLATIVDDD